MFVNRNKKAAFNRKTQGVSYLIHYTQYIPFEEVIPNTHHFLVTA